MKNLIKKLFFPVITLLLFILIILSIPRVSNIENISSNNIASYPVLQHAYETLCSGKAGSEIIVADTFYIVTIKNIWGNWQQYILPCFIANAPSFVQNNMQRFCARFRVIAPWSNENFFTNLCSLKITKFSHDLTVSQNTGVMGSYDIYPREYLDDSNPIVTLRKNAKPSAEQEFIIYYYVGTNEVITQDEVSCANFIWHYSLSICGKKICNNNESVIKQYTIMA